MTARHATDRATTTRSSARPRCCCTTTSTAGCGPPTVVELAAEGGHELPAHGDADALGRWFARVGRLRLAGALPGDVRPHRRGDADRRDALTRVARECVEDLAADGVVYAEVRYAPEQHVGGGLSLDEVVAAVQARVRRGDRAAAEAGAASSCGSC